MQMYARVCLEFFRSVSKEMSIVVTLSVLRSVMMSSYT